MKRHAALKPLSREHHGALVLALACERAAKSGINGKIQEACEWVIREFAADLEPHFRVEENILLPLLRQAGQIELVQRTLDDHARLRAMAESLRNLDFSWLEGFGKTLANHVRFEEQELFPVAEQVVPDSVLEAALSGPTTIRQSAEG